MIVYVRSFLFISNPIAPSFVSSFGPQYHDYFKTGSQTKASLMIEHAEESKQCYYWVKNSVLRMLFQVFRSFESFFQKKFQFTATMEIQGSLTCCSWLFTRRSHPQVEPLLASCCNRCSFFMIDSLTSPNMSFFVCCNAPYFQMTRGVSRRVG